jgi:glucokinase
MGRRIFLCMDIGGTKLSCALVSDNGEILGKGRKPTPYEQGASGTIPILEDMGRSLIDLARSIGEGVEAIGISFGGPVDYKRGRVLRSHHATGWEGFELTAMLERAFGLPAFMDNDANAAALGESLFGAGKGYETVLFLNIGTGIGGGITIGGRLHRGGRGLAGEIGHTKVDPNGPICTCGKRGCVEAFASGPSIARMAREELEKGDKVSRMLEICGGDPRAITGEMVAKAADDGDEIALSVIDRAMEYLAIGIANAMHLFDPDIVVIGGGVAKAGEIVFAPLREKVGKYLLSGFLERMPGIVPAALGDDAPLLGAMAIAKEGGR